MYQIKKYVKTGFAVSLFCFVSPVAFAQTVPAGDEPGQIEKRFQQPARPLSRPRRLQGLESTMPPAEAEKVRLKLRGIRVTGSTVFEDEEFQDIYADYIGKRVSLKTVFDIAQKITALYGKKGYTLSRIIVPPQELEPSGAIVHLRAVEGYIDQVIWPEGLEEYQDFFTSYAEKITAQRPITAQHMERYLLLANDLPGLKFKSHLKASERNPGASTMVLSLEKKLYSASISMDNRGTESSGPYQITASGTALNWLKQHESFTIGYTVAGPTHDSWSPELNYLSFGYKQILNAEGLTFDFSGNYSKVKPGTQTLRDLNYVSNGLNWSASMLYPFIRTREENFSGSIAFDYKNSESELADATSTRDKLRIVRGDLSYDNVDQWKGTNQIAFSLSKGIRGLGSTENGNALASRSNGRVDFTKATLTLSRTQTLQNNFSLYGSVFGQFTNDALLSSQECGYGGSSFGRGFDPSLIVGDRCFTALAELRYNVQLDPKTKTYLDYAQLYTVADFGRIWNLDAPLGTAAQDDASSAGIGLRLGKGKFNADILASRTLSEPTSTDNQRDWRVFFKASMNF